MKKSTKIIIAVVSVLVVAAIIFAVLFFATDLFKTKNSKKAFYEYLSKLAKSEGSLSYSDMLENLKKYQGKPYEGKGKMSMDIELGSRMSGEDYAGILEVLNDLEVEFEQKADPKKSNAYTSMNIKYDGKDLGTAEMLVGGETIGFKVKDATDKYITMTMKELFELFHIDTSSSIYLNTKNINVKELIEILDIDSDEFKRITNRYKKVLEDTIPEDNYSSEKEKITVNGKEINATAYTVKISEKDLMKLAKKVLESLQEDDDTINLVIEKVNKVMELTGEKSIKLNKSNVKSFIRAAISELEDTDDLSNEKLEISIYEYKDETVRVKLAVEDNAIIVDTLKDGNTTNMALKFKVNGTEMTLLNIEQTKKSDNAYTTKLSMDIQGFKFELTLDTEESDSVLKGNMKLYVEIPTMMKLTLNAETETEYKSSVSIDRLSSSNSVAKKSLTSAEQTQISYALLNYIDKHIDVIKDIATKLGYEDEIEKFETQLNLLKTQATTPTAGDDTEGE